MTREKNNAPYIDPATSAVIARDAPPESKSTGVGGDIRYASRLIASYFTADPWIGSVLLVGQLVFVTGGSYLLLKAAERLADITNALAASQPSLLTRLIFLVLAMGILSLFARLAEDFCRYIMRIRARAHCTQRMLKSWLSDSRFYHLEQSGKIDYPEQRIQEDIYVFVESVITLLPGLVASFAPLLMYSGKLFELSQPISIPMGSTSFVLHGSLFYAAAGFAIFWTVVTHAFGRGLTRTEVVRQRLEALFRNSMAGVRENGEAVALSRGADSEAVRLLDTFELIRSNWWHYTIAQLRVAFCVGLPPMVFLVLPSVLCAPYILKGKMKIGDIQLVGMAFQIVYMSFGVLIQSYGSLAILRSAVSRLRYFDTLMSEPLARGIAVVQEDTTSISTADLELALPNGERMVRVGDLSIMPGARIMIRGASGAGKSTFLRALAGLWLYGSGSVAVPAKRQMFFLSQKNYIPEGTLAALMTYPDRPEEYSEVVLGNLLERLGLAKFRERLAEYANWQRIMSPGELQRIVAARAILKKPDFLFIDEGTSALDLRSEENLYALFAECLSQTAIISVAHRSSLERYHNEFIDIEQRAVRRSVSAPLPA